MKPRLLYVFFLLIPLISCQNKSKYMKEMAMMSSYVPDISVSTPLVEDILLTKEYPGYLSAQQTVNLVARVNGTLQSMRYKPGDRVKKGQLLFVIEPTIYQDNLNQAEAALKTANSQLEYARNNYERMNEALKSDAVSRIQVIQAETTLSADEAALSNAKANLNTARTNLEYCYIRAPFDGTVSVNAVDVGTYINGAMGATTLATIYQDKQMYIYFNIADNQWFKMALDQVLKTNGKGGYPVEIKIGQGGNRTYSAVLDYLAPNVDMKTGTLTVRARLDNPNGELKSGTYVTVSLPYGEQKGAILVSPSSIGTDQLGKYLFVVNDSNVVKYRPIKMGELLGDTLQQVVSGLSSGEKYVTKALMKVRNDMKIKPVIESR